MYDPSWYRVADLKPRLRRHAQLHRHHYRGDRWYVLQDHSSGRYHRFSPAAYHVIALMDGERTLASIWESALADLGDDAPTQRETIRLFGQLHASDVLLCDVAPSTVELFTRHRKHARQALRQRLWSPLSQRFALLDPDAFLGRWVFLVRPLFGPLGAALWLLVVGTAAVLAVSHWVDLTENLADRVLTPGNLVLLAFVYPIVKVLHELGHGFATKVWGGEVHEMGIMLLVLMPVPYVDASAASAFRDKHRRVVVSAAGMAVEMFVAALALFAWLNVEPGAARAVAWNVMLIGGVSTLLFNGNPLLRFDAYYMLADYLEVPNLASRSTRYLGYLTKRYLFGARDVESPVSAPGEAPWLFLYGTTSFCYRMFIMVVIIMFVAGKFFAVGVVMALWAAVTALVVPATKNVAHLFTHPSLRTRRGRAVGISTVAIVGVLLAAMLVPVPLWTRAEGVVWPPESARVRAAGDGFVDTMLVEPGASVRAGDALVRHVDPQLDARVTVLEHRLAELDTRYTALRHHDRAAALVAREARRNAAEELADARERVQALTVHSPADGVLVVPNAADLPRRFVRHGELLGYVVSNPANTVRVVVPQSAIGLVREGFAGVEVKFAHDPRDTFQVALRRAVPAASKQLPSVALGTGGGGRIPVNPADEQQLEALEPVFLFDFELPPSARPAGLGAKVLARFDHGTQPLAQQGYTMLRQLLLRRFGV